MNAEQHFDATSAEFQRLCGLALLDAGFDPERFFHSYGDLAPREAALQAGNKYDLERVDLGWR